MTLATQTMRAVRVSGYGGPEQLKLEQVERPRPQAGEVLLRVHAAGVNPIDWKIRQGFLKEFMATTFPYTPGIEVAGVVEEVGHDVTAFQIGTASTANLDIVRSLGADMVIDYTKTPLQRAVQDVDLVLNAVGGETLSSSLATLRRGGTLISLAGPPPQQEAQARGVRAMLIHSQPSSEHLQMLARLIDAGQLKLIAGKTLPLSEVQLAQEYSQSGHGRGRIVLEIR